jgi:hypothetical protein
MAFCDEYLFDPRLIRNLYLKPTLEGDFKKHNRYIAEQIMPINGNYLWVASFIMFAGLEGLMAL